MKREGMSCALASANTWDKDIMEENRIIREESGRVRPTSGVICGLRGRGGLEVPYNLSSIAWLRFCMQILHILKVTLVSVQVLIPYLTGKVHVGTDKGDIELD